MNKILIPTPDQTVIPASKLTDFCQKLPKQFDQLGELVFAKRNTIRKVVVEGHTMIIKRYKRCNWIQGIGYGLQHTSKARKAYDNGQQLIQRGFRTPMPIAAIEVWDWNGWKLRECYYICNECTAECDLASALNQPQEFDKEVADSFAQYVAELHRQGILMIDLNSTNVLFDRKDLHAEDVRKRFQLIDINRMAFAPQGKRFNRTEEFENLTRFTGRMDVFEHVAQAYVKAQQWSNMEDMTRAAIAQKIKHDKSWRRRKAITHPLKHK